MAKAAKTATTGARTQRQNGGAPFKLEVKYKTLKGIEDAIDRYFSYCDNRTKSVYIAQVGDNVTISNPEPYTISGLAVALGIDRKTINNYGKHERFFPTIQRAKARVEADIDRRMSDRETFTPGLIFNAKNNFGWVDSQSVDHTTKGKELPTPILGGISRRDDDAIPSDDSDSQAA